MISSSSKFRQVFLNLIEYHYTLLTILTDCNFELTFIIYDCFKTITWEICESNRSLDKEKLNCFLSGQVLKTMLETHESTESLEKFLDWISLMISGDTKAYDILFSIQDNHIILIASCNLVSHSNSRLVFSVTRFLLIMLSSGMKQTIEICIKYRLDTLYPLILYIDKVVGSCFESIKRDHVPILKNILLFINSMAFNDARIISRQDINGLGGDWFELLVNGLLRITSEIEELGDLSRDMLAGMLIPEDYKILFA